MEGVDYSTARPNLDQLRAAGKRFVCRYLAYLPNSKVLQAAERAALHAKGFGIILNWEQREGDMLQGRAKGLLHATEALQQARALGAPDVTPIYFSCDVDTTSDSQRAAVAAYLDGCAAVLGLARVGVYGEAEVIDFMVPKHATWGWQTYAWSGSRTSDKAHFKQYQNGVQLAGGDVDLNRTLKDNFGAWWPASAATPEQLQENEMQLRVRANDSPQIWVVDGMLRRKELAGLTNDNSNSHSPGLLGALGNGGKVYDWPAPSAALDYWGVDVSTFIDHPAAKFSPEELAAINTAMAAALHDVAQDAVEDALEGARGQAAIVKADEFGEDH